MVKSNINISLIRKAIEKEKGKDVNVRVNLVFPIPRSVAET